jgi:hypothetical protein
MRYAEYIKEIEELQQTPLPLGQEWVRIPIRSAEQFRKCKEHRIDMYSDTIRQCKRSMKIDSKTMDNYNKLVQFFDLIPKIETIQKRDLKVDKNLGALLEEMKEFCSECKK